VRIDGRFLFISLLLSLLFHLAVVLAIFYFKGFSFFEKRPSLNFYEISIVGGVSPPKVKVRSGSTRIRKAKRAKVASKKVPNRKVVKRKSAEKAAPKRKQSGAKKEILVSKKRAKRRVKKRPPSSRNPSKGNLNEKLLEKKIKEFEEEKYLQQKLAQLKKSSESKEKGYVSESEGTGIKIKGKAEVDPLLAFYVAKLVERIRMNWILPEAKKGLEAIVDVKINKKGEAVEIKFEKRSGDIVFDESCIRAVKRSFPFEPLPFTYKEEY